MEPWYATGARRTLEEEDGSARNAFETSLRNLFSKPDWLANISRRSMRGDVFAGLTGASIALPQGVAFASIAGLPPEYGFYSAIIPPIVAALTGSSWHAVSGPTTAISALVFGALSGIITPGSPQFISAAITLALFVGLFQIALGLARLGAVVDFVSHSVMIGFVTGAALIIALSQLGHVLHINLPRPDRPIEFATELLAQIPEVDWRTLLIASVALGVGIGVRRLNAHLPSYLVALVVATVLSQSLGGAQMGIATVGAIDRVIPHFALPHVSLDLVRQLTGGAVAIAIVALLEAMSVARSMAAKSGQLLDGNKEFVGQGLSNVIGSFFQCYPSSASFTRSGVNYDSGAQTPLASIFAALFLVLMLLLIAPLFSVVPMSGLAGVIFLVAARLVEWQEIRHILTTSRAETLIAGATLACTLLVNMEFAIYAGVMMSLAFFVLRLARPVLAVEAPDPSSASRAFRSARLYHLKECPQLLVSRLDGPLYFGSTEAIRREFRRYRIERPSQKHILFITSGAAEIDMPAAELLIEEERIRQRMGGSFHLKVMTLRSLDKLARFRVLKAWGRKRIHLNKREAIAAIVPMLDPSICATCTNRIFAECPPLSTATLKQEGDG